MKITLTFLAAGVINLLLFWLMIQMVTADPDKQWIVTTDAQYFDFIRPRAKSDLIPRSARETPPKPESMQPESLSEPLQRELPLSESMRALPLPVPELKIEIPMARTDITSGPTLPAVAGSGQAKSGALASIPGSGGRGLAKAFIMADELTAISRPTPAYPETLRFRRIEGEVLVEFIVNREGRVDNPVVISSTPSGTFDRAALRAVRGWRFQPRRDEQGNPVDVRVRQFFAFSLSQ